MPEIEHGDKPLPRNGGGVYSLPATYLAVSGETIEAQQHNDPLEDLESDMNTVRPIVAGGTGASTAVGGHDAFSTKGSNVASATTCDIGAASGMFVHITGTTTIEGFGTKTAGVERILVFDGALTLTHNATSLILPGGANITTAAGDTAVMVSEGSGNWRCVAYVKADGTAIALPDAITGESLTLTSTDADAAAAPVVTLDRDSATPAASDVLGLVRFTGEDSAGNDEVYAEIEAVIVDPTSTSEDGKAVIRTKVAGTLADRVHVGAGAWMDGATGGDKGAGTINLAGLAYRNGGALTPLLHLQDQKATNTDGGTFTSGDWRTRTLNTEVTDEIGSTLSSNQFTLPAGTYEINATAPARNVGSHKLRLRNITDGSDTLIGISEYMSPTNTGANRATLRGRFTIAAEKTFELQHRCSSSESTVGFGAASNFSVTEIYADVMVWRVA